MWGNIRRYAEYTVSVFDIHTISSARRDSAAQGSLGKEQVILEPFWSFVQKWTPKETSSNQVKVVSMRSLLQTMEINNKLPKERTSNIILS